MITLEVCVENMQGILTARQAGAHRIELCAHLADDGLTPSYDLMQAAREFGPERMHVLIRCRKGDFVYSPAEVEEMAEQIEQAAAIGANGVVVGALTAEGDIDLPAMRRLMEAAEGMSVTFHRAFDVCRCPQEALEQIIGLGCDRVLTSGQAATAEEGLPLLKELVEQAGSRISIMPGAGVNADNAVRIMQQSGAKEIHGSFRTMQGGRLLTDKPIIQKILAQSAAL